MLSNAVAGGHMTLHEIGLITLIVVMFVSGMWSTFAVMEMVDVGPIRTSKAFKMTNLIVFAICVTIALVWSPNEISMAAQNTSQTETVCYGYLDADGVFHDLTAQQHEVTK